MSRVKAQLREFYTAQGLNGNHRRKATQYDLKQVKKLRRIDFDVSLMGLFNWSESPQGVNYWRARNYS